MIPNVISLFCGCGGSSLGYQRAGCKILLAVDYEQRALNTYRLNFPETRTLEADVRSLTGEKIRQLVYDRCKELDVDIDILDGSPPCSPFSMAGHREKKWGTEYVSNAMTHKQRTDDLFFEFIRLVDELKPKIFIAENVKGLVSGKAKGYYNNILRKMRSIGYKVEPFILNSKYFEVAQARERVIFIGYRNDLELDNNVTLKRHKIITVKEALQFIESNQDEIQRATIGLTTSKDYKIFMNVKEGEPFARYAYRRYNVLRLDNNSPANTIVAHSNFLLHPTKQRFITLSEAKALHSFPQSFKFQTFNEGFLRLGNSVPPNLIKNVVTYVLEKTYKQPFTKISMIQP